MDRVEKLELINRTLAIRHKIKVHEAMKAPDSHEELALMLLAKWELEDELRAIESILAESREANARAKRAMIERDWLGPAKKPSAKKSKK
jgi:hypothetical protein